MPDIFDEHTAEKQPPAQPQPLAPEPQLERMSPLSAFIPHPKGLTFANQTPSEEVILFLHKAFITNLSWITTTILLLLAPVAFFVILLTIHIPLPALPAHVLSLLIVFFYLLVIGFAFANFLTWFYNMGIVTQQRIVDISFSNISAINVSATSVDDIKNVEYSQKSFAESFFDYGDVRLIIEDTPGRTFVFEQAPHPAKVVDIISKLIQ